jgi:glycosyl hydrolase family 114
LSYDVQMYDVDLTETSASTVAAIHARGAKAVCYMETGSWESYRPDAGRYPASVLGNTMDGYPDERYVDIRQLSVLRPIIDARLDLCASKGFDGVEPDIDDSQPDVGASGIGFPVTYSHQIAFNRMVVEDAHARHLAIALKNGTFGDAAPQFVTDMEPLVDFAVSEECVQGGNLCGMLSVFTAHGKPVFHTEYLADYNATRADAQSVLSRFCPITEPLRFSSILKDASPNLTAWRAACPYV